MSPPLLRLNHILKRLPRQSSTSFSNPIMRIWRLSLMPSPRASLNMNWPSFRIRGWNMKPGKTRIMIPTGPQKPMRKGKGGNHHPRSLSARFTSNLGCIMFPVNICKVRSLNSSPPMPDPKGSAKLLHTAAGIN